MQSRAWFVFIIAPLSVLAFFIILLESGRAPFDLAEAEGELVAGYNVEYGGILFALFYLAEYFHIWVASGLYTVLFLGGFNFLYLNLALSVIVLLFKFCFAIPACLCWLISLLVGPRGPFSWNIRGGDDHNDGSDVDDQRHVPLPHRRLHWGLRPQDFFAPKAPFFEKIRWDSEWGFTIEVLLLFSRGAAPPGPPKI